MRYVPDGTWTTSRDCETMTENTIRRGSSRSRSLEIRIETGFALGRFASGSDQGCVESEMLEFARKIIWLTLHVLRVLRWANWSTRALSKTNLGAPSS